MAEPEPVVTTVLPVRSVAISAAVSPFAYAPAFSVSVIFTPSTVKSSTCTASSPIEIAVSVCATPLVPLVIRIWPATGESIVYVTPASPCVTSIVTLAPSPSVSAMSATVLVVATESAPVSSASPLKRARVVMLSISERSVSISSPIAVRSSVERCAEPACTVSSRMRWSSAWTSLSAPSAV